MSIKPIVVLVGAQSAIAQSMIAHFNARNDFDVVTLSRREKLSSAHDITEHYVTDYSAASLSKIAAEIKSSDRSVERLICCVGTLHDEVVFPEKRLTEMEPETLRHYFEVNSIIPAMVLKAFVPCLSREQKGVLAFLSAQIGSITDNRLGGWYGYRASKAALNMLVKTASIELKRTHKQLALVAMHPGTTDSPLSVPFQARIAKERLYSPEQTAERLLGIMSTLTPQDTGQLYHWDGSVLPW